MKNKKQQRASNDSQLTLIFTSIFQLGWWWVRVWLWMSIFLYHHPRHSRGGGGIVEGYPIGYFEQLVSGAGQPNDVYVDGIGGYMYFGTYHYVNKASVSGGAATATAGGGAVTSGNNIAATSAQMGTLPGICGDTAGNLYWTDSTYQVIWSYSSSGGLVNMIAGSYGSSNFGYTADGQPAKGNQIYSPWGIVLDTAGYLYWVEYGNQIVRKAAAVNGILKTIAGVQGSSTNGGDDGPATSASLSNPYYIFLDSNGIFYVTDHVYGTVRKITAASGIISTFTGGGGSPGNNIPATSATFGSSSLTGIAL